MLPTAVPPLTSYSLNMKVVTLLANGLSATSPSAVFDFFAGLFLLSFNTFNIFVSFCLLLFTVLKK